MHLCNKTLTCSHVCKCMQPFQKWISSCGKVLAIFIETSYFANNHWFILLCQNICTFKLRKGNNVIGGAHLCYSSQFNLLATDDFVIFCQRNKYINPIILLWPFALFASLSQDKIIVLMLVKLHYSNRWLKVQEYKVDKLSSAVPIDNLGFQKVWLHNHCIDNTIAIKGLQEGSLPLGQNYYWLLIQLST